MNTLNEIEIRRIREDAMLSLVRDLMRNARNNPERIGRRVQAFAEAKSTQKNQRQFAMRLGISKARASAALIEAEAVFLRIRNGDSTLNDPKEA